MRRGQHHGVGEGYCATVFATKDGDGAVLVKDDLVAEVLLPSADDGLAQKLEERGVTVAETSVGRRAAMLLEAYWRGERVVFDLPLLLPEEGSFRRRILDEVARIPYGQVRTYGEVAARAGSDGAARAVGAVMASNCLPIIIPCHRVVGSTGAMTGFTAPGGTGLKARLLAMEGVPLVENKGVAVLMAGKENRRL